MVLVMLSHWVSCLWLYLGRDAYRQHTLGWVERFIDSERDDVVSLYWRSQYWTVSTILTVGYGDVRAVRDDEAFFATVVILSGNVLFAYLVGLITDYINNLNLTAALFRDKLARLRNFMEYRQLTPVVQERIADLYSGRLWLSTGGVEEKTILGTLPISIRRNVSLLLYADLLIEVPLFQDAEFGFVQSLCDQLLPQVYPPLANVIQINEIGREMFFCVHGQCEVLDKEGACVFTISDGMFFGEVGVLFSVKCTATVRTHGYSDLLSLSKDALDDAMRDYPKQAEKISLLAQQRMQQLGISAEVKPSPAAFQG